MKSLVGMFNYRNLTIQFGYHNQVKRNETDFKSDQE